uniref:Uncharacterized protein n=1 Tax=Rousettus aegyptiacus TaxID=9407 RepID=A0A7J8JFM6_ROUAE|nr:hypothetical protein HJG63_010093 [Rousettus aegyptiacus]
MTLFVTFPRILVIQRKIRASEAQTSSSGGWKSAPNPSRDAGVWGGRRDVADTQLLPVTPAWDPLRGTPIGHTPGFVGARRARLGVDAPSAGTPPRAPVRGFPPTRRSMDRHTVIPRLRLCPRQDVMRPFTPHWVLTVGVAAGRGFASTRVPATASPFSPNILNSQFACLCHRQQGCWGRPTHLEPRRPVSTPTRRVSASPFPVLLAGTGLPPICKSQQ